MQGLALIRARGSRSNQGFTLIELLLVLVLIAIMAGLFVINISQSPQQMLEREAKRLQAVLLLAADEAVMQGVELGLSLPEGAYQIIQLNTEKLHWEAMSDDTFKYYQLPEFITIDFELDNQPLTDAERRQIERMKKRVNADISPPVILLLSSGELSPFRIRLSHTAIDYQLSLLSDGFSGVELRL